jgi:hypothetical protein
MGVGEMEEGAGQSFRERIGGAGGQGGARYNSSSRPLATKFLAQLTRLFGKDGETQQQPAAEKYVAKEEKRQEGQECNHTNEIPSGGRSCAPRGFILHGKGERTLCVDASGG